MHGEMRDGERERGELDINVISTTVNAACLSLYIEIKSVGYIHNSL